MSFETFDDGMGEYEVWTCDTCGFRLCLAGVGGDVCFCPKCEENDQ
jgi:hypothetical protein